jgi:hypothetical protein
MRSNQCRLQTLCTLVFCFFFASLPTTAQTPSAVQKIQTAKQIMQTISGNFEVKLAPQPMHDAIPPGTLNRLSLDKKFLGPLNATSKGEMLSAMGSVKGSAGYVAIERVTGTLDGRKGSFVLQHLGIMNRGTPSLTINVVPDSGTEDLVGLSGTMNIVIADGKHSYEFTYSLAIPSQ